MNEFAKLRQADRRLLILETLAQAPGYGVNEGILHQYLGVMKHAVSHDLLRTDLAWLAEQGLIVTEALEGVIVATLTGRGRDVAEGVTVVPGVHRPEPRD